MYKFRKAETKEEKESLFNHSYGGEWIYGTNIRGEETYALFLGKMIALFGDSGNMSDDWEQMYTYEIIAEDEQGNKLGVEIYHGAGGPSFAIPIQEFESGIDLAPYKQAAKELIEYIEAAKPADYEWNSVYYDIPVNVRYIVKDGKARVESEFPDEFEDM